MALPAEPQTAPRRSRVLIVDDSVVVRGLMSRWIGQDPAFELLPPASDGKAALATAQSHRPDIVLLDLDMPVMDGMQALPELVTMLPDAAIVIASSLTRRNAGLSLRCLSMGAVDVLAKPESNRDLTLSTSFRSELMQRLHDLRQARPNAARGMPTLRAVPESAPASALTRDLAALIPNKPRMLVIGASTGGPRAITRVLSDMRQALPGIATLIVQHMPPVFTASFAEQIGSLIGVPTFEAEDGMRIARGCIYVAPGGRHMGMRRNLGHPVIRLDDGDPISFCKPAVDLLFQDAAAVLGRGVLGLVLTGMGRDGRDGAHALHAAGCGVIVQDEPTSVVWGMPGAIAKAGIADAVMPLSEIGLALRTLFLKGTGEMGRPA
jgi:two-component system, chemotaxis family, protein-glutamate methylesterase/glutaminase